MNSLIIDSSYLIFRSFFAYPQLNSTSGEATGAVYGFIKTIQVLQKEYQPEIIVFAKDLPKPTWRHKIHDVYKAGRPEPDPIMIKQIPIIHNWSKLVSPNTFALEGFEADDIIFTSAINLLDLEDLQEKSVQETEPGLFESQLESSHQDFELEKLEKLAKTKDQNIYVFSSDKDLYQLLIFPQVKFVKAKKANHLEVYGQSEFELEFGLKPIQWLDFKALVGDNSDNLKGIDGVGPKTATKILNQIGSLSAFYKLKNLDNSIFRRSSWKLESENKKSLSDFVADSKNQKIVDKMLESYEQVKQTYNLACLQMVPDIKLKREKPQFQKGIDLYKKYNFKSLLGDAEKQKAEDSQEALF